MLRLYVYIEQIGRQVFFKSPVIRELWMIKMFQNEDASQLT